MRTWSNLAFSISRKSSWCAFTAPGVRASTKRAFRTDKREPVSAISAKASNCSWCLYCRLFWRPRPSKILAAVVPKSVLIFVRQREPKLETFLVKSDHRELRQKLLRLHTGCYTLWFPAMTTIRINLCTKISFLSITIRYIVCSKLPFLICAEGMYINLQTVHKVFHPT